jgi:hypothetical protein
MKKNIPMIKKGSKVDLELLIESLRISKKLAKAGFGSGRTYSLPPPYQNRLVRTTPAEILTLREEESLLGGC